MTVQFDTYARLVDWDMSDEWSAVMGDNGPWIRHLPAAWQAAATNAPDRPRPARPRADAELDEQIAYWAPLLHLVIYGLGWTRPDLGLARWREQGRPITEPILRVVDRWWGDRGVLDLLAWAASNGGLTIRLGPHTERWTAATAPSDRRPVDTPEYKRRREAADWQTVWGGGSDPMHLTQHLAAPLVYPDRHDPTYFDARWVDEKDASQVPRFLVASDTYAGWYADFFHYMPGLGPNGRSIRTDILVKPIGWLGEFRQHKQTGLWFRGRSAFHLWGQ